MVLNNYLLLSHASLIMPLAYLWHLLLISLVYLWHFSMTLLLEALVCWWHWFICLMTLVHLWHLSTYDNSLPRTLVYLTLVYSLQLSIHDTCPLVSLVHLCHLSASTSQYMNLPTMTSVYSWLCSHVMTLVYYYC